MTNTNHAASKKPSSVTTKPSGIPEMVSVIIPTIGRPELREALDSVRRQTHPSLEIIVVADFAADDPRAAFVHSITQGHELRFTGGQLRGAHARNLGIQESTGPWVALLDDDDRWRPNKIETQLTLARDRGATLVSSRVDLIAARNRAVIAEAVPTKLLKDSQSPAEYLFRKRHAGSGRQSLFTSTLMVRSDIALSTPWDEGLSRHQDWDWVIRLSRDPRFSGAHCTETLVDYQVGSSNSISRGSDWHTSFEWALTALADAPRSVRVDFLFAQTLRYALQAKSLRGVRTVLGQVLRERRAPGLGPALIGGAGLLGRRRLERAMGMVK